MVVTRWVMKRRGLEHAWSGQISISRASVDSARQAGRTLLPAFPYGVGGGRGSLVEMAGRWEMMFKDAACSSNKFPHHRRIYAPHLPQSPGPLGTNGV